MSRNVLSAEERNNLLDLEIKKYKQKGYILKKKTLYSADLRKIFVNPVVFRSSAFIGLSLIVLIILGCILMVIFPVLGFLASALAYACVFVPIGIAVIGYLTSVDTYINIIVDEFGDVKITSIRWFEVLMKLL